MSICSKVLRDQGKPYPRTCAVHGLGPCDASDLGGEYKLSHLLEEAAKYVTGAVRVRIVRRDEEGAVTHSALVPIHRVKTDFDGKGVEIMIDESRIKWEVHR